MLTRPFTLQESESYDDLTDEKFARIADTAQEVILAGAGEMHFDSNQHDPSTHVKIRVLHNQPVARETPQRFE